MVRWGTQTDRQGEIYLSQITVSGIGFSCIHRWLGGVGLERDDRCHWFLKGIDEPYPVIKLLWSALRFCTKDVAWGRGSVNFLSPP